MINLDRYITAWKERQQGKTYKQIGLIMGVTKERVRQMVNIIDYKRKRNGKKHWKILELNVFDKIGKNNGS